MDLIFPHHECEIAQAVASQGSQMVKYWMHNNMITINGQKMGKSLGNFITLEQFFTGSHPSLKKPYGPMTIRFFILSAHYRGPVDFSDEALLASEKGLERLMDGFGGIDRIKVSEKSDDETGRMANSLRQKCYDAMNDDLSTPQVISYLFEACQTVNRIVSGKASISKEDLDEMSGAMRLFAFDILGLKSGNVLGSGKREEAFSKVMDIVLDLRAKAREAKDWQTCDKIRDTLKEAGFEIKDTKDGSVWKLNA